MWNHISHARQRETMLGLAEAKLGYTRSRLSMGSSVITIIKHRTIRDQCVNEQDGRTNKSPHIMRSQFLPKTTRIYKVNIIVVPCKISHMSCVLHANTFGYFTAAVLKLCWSRFESAAHSLLALWCYAIARGWAMLISERRNLPKSCSCLSTLTLSRCFSSPTWPNVSKSLQKYCLKLYKLSCFYL